MSSLEYEVVDNPDESRYEARLSEGGPEAAKVVGVLRYAREGDVVVMPSTVTDPEYRGNGIAAALTRTALDDVRAAGQHVRALCWYVDEWIDRHPDYADLRA
jgi:predicted GNAT family acetyltransferase